MSADKDNPNLFSKHMRAAYREDAANPRYPNASRVAFLAYGNHLANGHARFKAREIANVLGSYDDEGTFVPASKHAVQRAINTAIEWGLLETGSKALCLIVPGHRIRGHIGDPEAPCDRHRGAKGAALRAVSSPKGAVSPALSSAKGAAGRAVSRSAPSLLSIPTTGDRGSPAHPDERSAS